MENHTIQGFKGLGQCVGENKGKDSCDWKQV